MHYLKLNNVLFHKKSRLLITTIETYINPLLNNQNHHPIIPLSHIIQKLEE